jgi:hypothetical protein
MPDLNKMASWSGRTKTGLRRFYAPQGRLWIEQNQAKDSPWARLAAKGHDIAWEFEGPKLGYTGPPHDRRGGHDQGAGLRTVSLALNSFRKPAIGIPVPREALNPEGDSPLSRRRLAYICFALAGLIFGAGFFVTWFVGTVLAYPAAGALLVIGAEVRRPMIRKKPHAA